MTTDPTRPKRDLRDLHIALNAAPQLSRPAVYRLAQEAGRWFGVPAPAERLAAAVGVPLAQMRKALAVAANAPALAAREMEAAERLGARILLLDAAADSDYPAEYPAALRALDPPPPVLYARGTLLPPPPSAAVAVVGSRRADSYGQEVATLFARELAAAGVAVVSGFAHGIDAAAHRGALAAEGGTTVAVLGCGLGVDYPRGHARLGEEIAERGALLTELPCGLAPRAWHFPVRNRVIAALAAGTLVVQAAPRSGSLITAHHALELGREVWAVPGRIFDERSAGPNALIRDGAVLVQHPREILEVLHPPHPVIAMHTGLSPAAAAGFTAPPPPPPEDLPPGLAARVHAALTPGTEQLPEEIAAALAEPVDEVLGALLELELAGHAKRRAGGTYSR